MTAGKTVDCELPKPDVTFVHRQLPLTRLPIQLSAGPTGRRTRATQVSAIRARLNPVAIAAMSVPAFSASVIGLWLGETGIGLGFTAVAAATLAVAVLQSLSGERVVSADRCYTLPPSRRSRLLLLFLATATAGLAVASLAALPALASATLGVMVGTASVLLVVHGGYGDQDSPKCRVSDPALRLCLQRTELRLLDIERRALFSADAQLAEALRQIVTEVRSVIEPLCHHPTGLFRVSPFLLLCLDRATACHSRLTGVAAWVNGSDMRASCHAELAEIADTLHRERPRLVNDDLTVCRVRDGVSRPIGTHRRPLAPALPIGDRDLRRAA